MRSPVPWHEVVFDGRLLPVILLAVARAWSVLRIETRRTLSTVDALLAATAQLHDMTLVTRNTRDFAGWAGPQFNPWSE
ncbi:MAG: PIN domain-containing protein [Caulobacteraceae bacterium]